jgi:hypothetical protein
MGTGTCGASPHFRPGALRWRGRALYYVGESRRYDKAKAALKLSSQLGIIPGICMMGDFYHMYIEETSDLGAFISAGKYLHHVHLASRRRVLPGQDERQFVDGFRGLKWIGYQDYCSFECGVRGNPMVEIPKSMAFLRDQWEKAES